MKFKIFLIVTLLMILPFTASAETITITNSIPTDQVFDNQILTVYAQISNNSMLRPYMRFSFPASEPQPPFMDDWAPGIFKQNVNFSQFPEGNMQILAVSGDYYDSINVTVNHTADPEPEPTPTPTPEPLKNFSIEGLKSGTVIDNNNPLILTVIDNETGKPVPYPTWHVLCSTNRADEGIGYNDGMVWIDWISDLGTRLVDGIYRIEIMHDDYEKKGFVVTLKTPAPEEEPLPQLVIYGFDEIVTPSATSRFIIMDKSGEYIPEVSVKVSTEEGIVTNSKVTDTNGRVSFDWNDFAAGDLIVEFSKPGYKRSVKDLLIYATIPTPTPSSTPSPTLTPTPTSPTPTPTPSPTSTSPDIDSSQPATSSEGDTASNRGSWFGVVMGVFSLVVVGGVALVKFPDELRNIKALAAKTLSAQRRAVQDRKEKPVCHGTNMEGNIELACQEDAVPGEKYCLIHLQNHVTGMVPPDPEPETPEEPETEQTAPDPEPETEEEPEPTEEPVIEEDSAYYTDEAIQAGLDFITNGKTENQIGDLMKEKYGQAPSAMWISKLFNHVNENKNIEEEK